VYLYTSQVHVTINAESRNIILFSFLRSKCKDHIIIWACGHFLSVRRIYSTACYEHLCNRGIQCSRWICIYTQSNVLYWVPWLM